MGRLRYARTAGAVAMVVTLGSAGCAGEPEPRFAPSEGPSPSASEAASPSVSRTPSPKSEAPEPLDREETVRAWVEARNDALQDGDTSGMSELYADSCEGCDLMNAAIEDVYEAGGYYETPGWEVLDTTNLSAAATDLRAQAAAGEAREAAGADLITFPAAIRELRFSLYKRDHEWLISNIAVLTG